MTATNWLLYQLTDSPFQLGLNGVFRAVPAIFLGLDQRHVRRSLRQKTSASLDPARLGIAHARTRYLGSFGEHSGLADLCFHVHQRSRRFFRRSRAPSAVPISGASLRLAQCRRAEFTIVERRSATWAFAGRHRH